MPEKTLQPDVAAKYDLTGLPAGRHQVNGFGTVDLEKLTVAQADALVARDFAFLKLKSKAKVPPAPKKENPGTGADPSVSS